MLEMPVLTEIALLTPFTATGVELFLVVPLPRLRP